MANLITQNDIAEAQEQYSEELRKLNEDPAHYITPGAKKALRRMVFGYVILAIACIIGVWAISTSTNNRLKNDINRVARIQCLNNLKPNSPLNKYNDFVEANIQNIRETREINLSRGDKERVRANNKAIIRLQKDKITLPTKEACEAPIIK